MKRFYLIFFLLTATAILLQARNPEHLFSVGLRGGVEKFALQSDGKFAPTANMDIRYTYYGHSYSKTQCGIMTGLSFGYEGLKLTGSFADQFSNTDYLGNQMDYTTSGDFTWKTSRLNIEIPILFALRSKGFVFRVGPKLQLPLVEKTKQTLSNTNIDAYYPAYGVHVTNELVTGLPQESDLNRTFKKRDPLFSILLGMEIGYEWKLRNWDLLGLAFYADYSVWNTHKQDDASPVIAVAPITNRRNPVPTVSLQYDGLSRAAHINPLQVGVSVYYTFTYHQHKYLINYNPHYILKKR